MGPAARVAEHIGSLEAGSVVFRVSYCSVPPVAVTVISRQLLLRQFDHCGKSFNSTSMVTAVGRGCNASFAVAAETHRISILYLEFVPGLGL
jgi:hypothetical protein